MSVTCEYCNKEVYGLTGSFEEYECIMASMFRGINGFDNPEPGDPCDCPNCDSPLMNSIRTALEGQVVGNV